MKSIFTLSFLLFLYHPIFSQTAEDYFKKGKTYADSSNFSQASLYYSLAIKLNPNDWRFYQSRSWAFYKLKGLQSAIDDINMCLFLKPKHENSDALQSRAKLFLENGDYLKSIEDWTYLITYFPNEFVVKIGIAYLFRGQAYLYSNNKYNACVDFQYALNRKMADAKSFIEKFCN